MIEITYQMKDYIGEVAPEPEIETMPKGSRLQTTLEKADTYNKNINSDWYIAQVTKIEPKGYRKTTLLSYFKPVSRQPFKLKGKESSVLGANAFDCIYLIPLVDLE